ncbi:MAG: hypothetical protein A2W61_03745 [Deltaproteobacteria bacterium RIFCSPLOWO2_01_44_7]|nr:MAG: hypothetical protein A2712_08130 [Deltaproteobacteria bacterium RIFCSPHIGHO2_01_FULL_43_49]OGQ14695.1 MAG: hypothetical protein A3D22_08870 [Deltaproteobacteria bacterium RIFCSPHIGHO2_02_FULL_44_53]OGQ28081.1 MAG: hypothetical protein A3D98_07580 [Deltaproteobacteria bacterium RIFCSPHIGHO2_12_FULL_44_21]OGQ31293.1 MAG: hypothetical protein A2979_07630 [Deltaproteobacteria bacterium RIFCSPLOWO2_01_FULL_45_74]OGQ41275.1 MAG: hypothetical protein A2W61_03745 [Deltaproteobacteria bacterium 
MKFSRFGILVIGSLLVVVVGISFIHFQREQTALRDDLNRRARVISKSLAPPAIRILKNPPAIDEEDVAERLEGQGRTIGLMICNLEGKPIALSSTLTDTVTCNDEVMATLESGKESILLDEIGGQSLHRLILPLKDRTGSLLGTLTIVHDSSYITKRVTSAVTWMTLSLAILAIVIALGTYLASRRSFQRSVTQLLDWMKSSKSAEDLPPPTESLLRPVSREVEKLTARLRAAKETAKEVSEANRVSNLWTGARLKGHATFSIGNKSLIVVSNREPYMHVKKEGKQRVIIPASGLVTALDPVLRATSGIWIAHGSGEEDRDFVNSEDKILVPPESPLYTLRRIWLTREEEERYYYGFSNEAVWPLCHLTHHRPHFEEKDWQSYIKVNEKFADAVLQECGKDQPFVLVQDYHFTLLPKLIRERRPDAVVGLFWHIPWPTPESFQICPWKREILEGMLGANFVGFHLQSYCNNFLDTVNSLLPVRIDWDRPGILHNEGLTTVKPFPIGVQLWSERGVASDERFREKANMWRKELELNAKRLIVSVDRLDYTKGIPERIGAIDRFLEKYPAHRGKVVFVQLAAPSRVHIPRYREFVTEVEGLVEQINWRHGTEDWKPILFLKSHHDPETVYTFLRMADVCIISSLSDGMNLVAKEFVAAREKGDGVLILSEFTGAAREFQDALQINPYARADFAEVIRVAIEMPMEEQKKRMSRMKAQVIEHNVYGWAANLITEMTQTVEVGISSRQDFQTSKYL